MSFPAIPKTVLITGCSSGIGLAAAEALRARGWTVYPTARKDEDLKELRTRGFEAIELDLVASDSVQAAAARALELCDGRLGGVVNNAGYGQPGALEDLGRDALRRQFEVNLFGLHELTRALTPAFRRQQAGRIVNVSSVVGRVALPFLGAYCASKFALEALSDAWRIELCDTGIAVSLIEPGPIVTAFRNNAYDMAAANLDPHSSPFGEPMLREVNRKRGIKKVVDSFNRPPEAVALKIRHALESPRPRRRYCVTLPAYAGAWIRRLAPYALTDALLAGRVRRIRDEVATQA